MYIVKRGFRNEKVAYEVASKGVNKMCIWEGTFMGEQLERKQKSGEEYKVVRDRKSLIESFDFPKNTQKTVYDVHFSIFMILKRQKSTLDLQKTALKGFIFSSQRTIPNIFIPFLNYFLLGNILTLLYSIINLTLYFQHMSRLLWTQNEDLFIRELKEERGIKSWIKISELINSKTFSSTKRTPKQCRDRYINFSRLLVSFSEPKEWSQESLIKLEHTFLQHGTKWKAISEQFPARSQNNVKNKFYSLVRKLARRINNARKNKNANLRMLKEITIIRCLQACRESFLNPSIKQNSNSLPLAKEKLFHSIFRVFLEIEKQTEIEQKLIDMIGGSIVEYMTRPYKKTKKCPHSYSECADNPIRSPQYKLEHSRQCIQNVVELQKIQENFESQDNFYGVNRVGGKQNLGEKKERISLGFKKIESSSENDEYEYSLIREADLIQQSIGIFQEF